MQRNPLDNDAERWVRLVFRGGGLRLMWDQTARQWAAYLPNWLEIALPYAVIWRVDAIEGGELTLVVPIIERPSNVLQAIELALGADRCEIAFLHDFEDARDDARRLFSQRGVRFMVGNMMAREFMEVA